MLAMSIVVKNNIHWVGQRDWEVRDFHGTEYKTLRGSSYNSYLIREEKNVPIWMAQEDEYEENR